MLAEARKAIAKAQNVDRAALDADEDLAAAFAWRLSLIGEAAARYRRARATDGRTCPGPKSSGCDIV